ncbi:hypothetical protein N9K72_04175 [Pontimonas sp.]|nr:hypothetical protein [Pontimonas sp.]
MGKQRSSVLHVVVGAGIIPHFHNAIQSIIRNTEDVVFAVYNSISADDAASFANFVATSEVDARVVLTTIENGGPSKTGSLYNAYNLAIDYATERDFDYLNFVQSDCQLMWWSDGVVNRLDEIFSAAEEADGPGVLCVGTTFPVFGKYVGSLLPSVSRFNANLGFYAAAGAAVGDVGVFSMSGIRASGFRFIGTEAELQNTYRRKNVPSLDVPCVAFIPWPATVRNGKVTGTVVEPLPVGTPFLRLEPGFTPDLLKNYRENGTFWMEDWIAPNGWDCLFPYWPTSIENPKWLKRRLLACREWGVKPWAKASQVFDHSAGAAPAGKSVPAGKDVALALGLGYFRRLDSFLHRMVLSFAKRARSMRVP